MSSNPKVLLKIFAVGIALDYFLSFSAYFKFGHHYHTQWPGPCREVKGIVDGSEDGEMITGDIALVTSGLCWLTRNPDKKPSCNDNRGKFYLFDFNDPDAEITQANIEWQADDAEEKARHFHPHGLTTWKEGGQITVMVVNHEAPHREFVEIFLFDETTKSLKHQQSIANLPGVTILNDIKATGPTSFYFTNYCRFPWTPVFSQLEYFLLMKLGWVGHYDGTTGHVQVVAEHILEPNGIQMSPDGKYVYLSNIGHRSIDTFIRHPNNSLKLNETTFIHVHPDNIALEVSDSALWVATMPVPWRVFLYGVGLSAYCPSQVLKLDLENGVPTGNIQQIYSGNNELPGVGLSSLGLYHKSRLLIGTPTGQAAVCDVSYLP